jgi:hypothetical protein
MEESSIEMDTWSLLSRYEFTNVTGFNYMADFTLT